MANPQKENGNTQIANEILEALLRSGINGTEWAVVMFLLRKTYGWHKKEDCISLSQFVENIPVTKKSICTALKHLKLVKIITLVKKSTLPTNGNSYTFNKDYDSWSKVVKKSTLVKKRLMGSVETVNGVVKKSTHTKETSTKETIQKKGIYNDLKFNDFWKIYPNKKGKQEALRKWITLSEEEKDTAIKVLPDHIRCEQWFRDGGRFIPFPATWLNQGRWEDEIKLIGYTEYGSEFANLSVPNREIILRRIKSYAKTFVQNPTVEQINHWIKTEL